MEHLSKVGPCIFSNGIPIHPRDIDAKGYNTIAFGYTQIYWDMRKLCTKQAKEGALCSLKKQTRSSPFLKHKMVPNWHMLLTQLQVHHVHKTCTLCTPKVFQIVYSTSCKPWQRYKVQDSTLGMSPTICHKNVIPYFGVLILFQIN